ncbi:MAG TPA: PDC sensor domain-containing protein [Terriglobia bacterium]|nr:PDC sensor domain-containing protein [Terriglobia bacterium]
MMNLKAKTVLTVLIMAGGISVAATAAGKIFAQQLVEEAMAKYPQVSAVELSSTPPGKTCVTIASTEAGGVGEKCDNDEFTAMKTNKPFVEKEIEGGKEVYDITMPFHDASGKLIGTVGLDFKPEPGQQELQVVQLAGQLVHEMEMQLPAKARLFESGK